MSPSERISREFYALVQAGKVEDLLGLLSEEIVWTIPGSPLVPYAGVFHGKAGVGEFFRILAVHEDLIKFEPHEFIVDSLTGTVCVLGCETAIARASGRKFQTTWAEVFHVRNERIVAFTEFIDTQVLDQAYAP